MRLFVYCLFLFLVTATHSQKPFTGKLVYSVEIADTSLHQLFPPSTMTIFTNDTILRIETNTDQLGKQVLIRHLKKNKAYLLIETATDKYAIQIPETEKPESKKYTYKKAKGKKEICGLSSRKLNVFASNTKQPLEYYYHKSISAKYIPGFENFPGLLTDYYVLTKDGIYHHQLTEVNDQPVPHDLFGIPSDYKKISMSEFVDIMTGANGENAIEE